MLDSIECSIIWLILILYCKILYFLNRLKMLRKIFFGTCNNVRFSIKFSRYPDYKKSLVCYHQINTIKAASKMMTVEKRHFDNPFPEFVPHKENHLVDLQTKKVCISY